MKATALLAARAGVTVADLRAGYGLVEPGIDPEDAYAMHPAYEVEIEFDPQRPDRMDITFRRRGQPPPLRASARSAADRRHSSVR